MGGSPELVFAGRGSKQRGDQNDQVVFGWPSVGAGLRVCLGYEARRRTTAAELRFSGIGRFQSATPPCLNLIIPIPTPLIREPRPEKHLDLPPRRHSRCTPLSLSECSGLPAA